MRLQITHLKAPWPLGAVVGDVLDFPAVPVWAIGKCKPAEVMIATGEGEGVGQPIPGIDRKHKGKK